MLSFGGLYFWWYLCLLFAAYPNCLCGCHSRLLIGSQVAMELRQALWEELGITGCAGIAHNKLLSKLVAGAHKPNQQTTLFPDRGMELLSTLKSVKQIPGRHRLSSYQLPISILLSFICLYLMALIAKHGHEIFTELLGTISSWCSVQLPFWKSSAFLLLESGWNLVCCAI